MGLGEREYYRQPVQRTGFPWPRTTVGWLMLINIGVFVADAFSAKHFEDLHWLGYHLAFATERWWALWTYITYGFTHSAIDDPTAGIWHIVGNLFALFFFGRAIEQDDGPAEFLRFYLVGILAGLMGIVAAFLVNPEIPRIVIGASSAVTAVVILFALRYPHQRVHLFGVLPMPAWILGVLLVALDLLRAFSPADTHIAWQSHLAGAAWALAYHRWRLRLHWLTFEPLRRRLAGRPKLRVHRQGHEDLQEDVDELARRADELLEKVHRVGEAGLTPKEHRLLKKYSQRLNQRRRSS